MKHVRKIAAVLFLVYFTYLLYRLFFFAYGHYYRYYENQVRFNLIPFKTIAAYIAGIRTYKLNIWFFNLFGNVIAFIPMGLLIPIIFYRLNTVKRITVVIFVMSVIFEALQFWLKLGVADIDDVILNTVGGLIGYLILDFSQKIISQKYGEMPEGSRH